MKNLIIFAFIFNFITTSCASDSTTIFFYNIENLFDTKDDTLKDDAEFLPNGIKNWNYDKYNEKCLHIAQTITAANFPDIIGFAEIENENVLKSIISHPLLKQQNYQIIHFESNDLRGIDVAILYKQNRINPLNFYPIKTKTNGRTTRDILAASFIVNQTDTLTIFVNHWPSRFGGKKKSLPNRMIAAQTLKTATDSVIKNHPKQTIICVGDFNDEPKDPSMKSLNSLINLTDTITTWKGTIKYKGKWQKFDQCLIGGNTKASFHHEILHFPFLLEEDLKFGGYQPFRTFRGPKYLGGFSDHLPIITKINW